MKPLPAGIRRILIRSNNWIGDVVMISPAVKALREAYPDARIDVVARPHVADCYATHPWVDGVVLHEPRGRHRGISGYRSFVAEVRRQGYDMAVLFQKAFGAALMAWMAGIPARVGYDTDRRGLLLTHKVRETDWLRGVHHVEYFLQVAGAAGASIDRLDPRVHFHVDKGSRAFADEFLGRAGAGRFSFLAVFATGASKAPRAWHAERFGDLARRLAEDRGAGIVVVGGPSDRADAGVVLRAAGPAGIDAVGNTSVRQMAALIERARIFVGNDSGPMHVAAALDVPTLALFGPGIPAKTAPYMAPSRYIALTNAFTCAPCRQDFFRECEPAASLKPMCLETISVRQAAEAMERLLDRT